MSERIFKIIVRDKNGQDNTHWLHNPAEITTSFGRVVTATQYDLLNPLDITSQCNGDYML
jgi:hypothetical protein